MNTRRLASFILSVPGVVPAALLVMLFSAFAFVSPVSAATYLSENFDGVAAPALPTGWATVPVYFPSGTEPRWATNVGTLHPSGTLAHSAPNVAYFNSYSTVDPKSARLHINSVMNLSLATSLQLTFWMYHDTGYAGFNDRVQPQVSIDGGTNWTDAGAAFIRYDGTTGWVQHTVDLSSYIGETNVRISFLGISGFGNDCHIDDVEVTGESAAAISGMVTYAGSKAGPIYVAALTAPCTSGASPVAQTGPLGDPPVMYGLTVPAGTYYICAFLDAAGDGPPPSPGDPTGELSNDPVTMSAGINYIEADIQLQDPIIAVPTMTQCGMIVFILLAGLRAAFCLRRQRKAER